METMVKKSGVTRKSGKKSVTENVAAIEVKSPAGLGTTSGGVAPIKSGASSASSRGKVHHDIISTINNAVSMENEFSVIELRTRIAQNWAAPEWSGAAALRASLASLGSLTDEQISAAVAAAARKSGENLDAVTPSLDEVCTYISEHFAAEFKAVCGASCPSAAAARLYEYTDLSTTTISAGSSLSDYLRASSIPSGLSASGLVAALMSIRVAVDVRRRFAAARAAARNDFRESMAAAARRALGLGLSAAVASRYFSMLLVSVPLKDEKEKKRLNSNLSRCWDACKRIEVDLVQAGCHNGIEIDGGYVFPASLPTSAPAKVRKLWAKRERLLSSIHTLSVLLDGCA